jgi:hypothetical protein
MVPGRMLGLNRRKESSLARDRTAICPTNRKKDLLFAPELPAICLRIQREESSLAPTVTVIFTPKQNDARRYFHVESIMTQTLLCGSERSGEVTSTRLQFLQSSFGEGTGYNNASCHQSKSQRRIWIISKNQTNSPPLLRCI